MKTAILTKEMHALMMKRFLLLPFLLWTLLALPAFAVNEETVDRIASAYLDTAPSKAGPLVKELSNEAEQKITNLRAHATCPDPDVEKSGYTVNFENIKVIELIRFVSQISGLNFIFDSSDLQFPITIVSQDPTSVEDLMSALLQVLRMQGLSVLEQGNNVLIYGNAKLSKMSRVVSDSNVQEECSAPIVTRVFRIYNISPEKIVAIVRPLMSKDAIVESSPETRHLIVTDITSNVEKVADLLNALDMPNAALDFVEYHVQSAEPQTLVAYAREILAPWVYDNPLQMIPQVAARKIFLVSTPSIISKALQVLKSLDTPEIATALPVDLPSSAMPNNNFQVYKMRYQNGQEIASAIRTIGVNLEYLGVANPDLINTIYALEWIEVNNSLVITGSQTSVEKVLQLVTDLDKAPDQVYIEVLIIDTTVTNSLNFGVQWVALGNEQNKLAFASGYVNAPAFGAGSIVAPAQAALLNPPPNAANVPLPTPMGFGLGVVGNVISHGGKNILTMGALLTALEGDAESKVVQNPRIMAEDNKEASFFVGENIPYQTTNTVIRDTGSVTTNLQYEDVGVMLRVIPQIAPDGMVALQIDQSITDVVSSAAVVSTVGGDTSYLAPTTTKTLTTTRVHVPDGAFLVMSGHIRDDLEYSHQGIPCLGSLPWIGPAFSTTSESRTKRNLIMFIRPHIVSNIAQGLRLTNQEGYQYNFDSSPCSIIGTQPLNAPECETYPAPECPCN